jgi:L,D-transpeptidase catalytic domain
MFSRFVSFLLLTMVLTAPLHGRTLDGVTFFAESGRVFIPLTEAASKLNWTVERDEKNGLVKLNNTSFPVKKLRRMFDGTELISTENLAAAGAKVTAADQAGVIRVGGFFKGFKVAPGIQRVEVSLAKQVLQGWQGNRLVINTRISSGKGGCTPAGEFKAGPHRELLHHSRLYNNAPMPWSVQINGHIFVHGSKSVPNYPASHGCVRMPLTGGNAAKFFYEWVLSGTPVSVRKD